MIRLLFALMFAATPALAEVSEKIVAGLSQNRVSITANFDGSEILIYGAIKRDEPAPTTSRLEMIITVQGPNVPLVIRRNVLGINVK